MGSERIGHREAQSSGSSSGNSEFAEFHCGFSYGFRKTAAIPGVSCIVDIASAVPVFL
ncbi:hypothetical protein CSC34_2693 [Pseudomonas aeruginosa]|nr:hypothetical protein CSC34_2693 [Pseudomonas aeruginosa]